MVLYLCKYLQGRTWILFKSQLAKLVTEQELSSRVTPSKKMLLVPIRAGSKGMVENSQKQELGSLVSSFMIF